MLWVDDFVITEVSRPAGDGSPDLFVLTHGGSTGGSLLLLTSLPDGYKDPVVMQLCLDGRPIAGNRRCSDRIASPNAVRCFSLGVTVYAGHSNLVGCLRQE